MSINILNNRILHYSILLICLLLNGIEVKALGSLMKYSSQSGTMTSINKGKVYKDQQGGYLSGGSIIMRGPRPQELQPLMVQPPRFGLDACTGSFDARFGGISYISSQEFNNFFKKVTQAAGAYALKMSIKTLCPQCEGIMSDLEAIARDINGMSLEQCQLAQSLAGGAFGMLNASSKQQCMMRSNVMGGSSDIHQATEKCTDNSDSFSEAKENEELKSLLGDNFNLVWKALRNSNSVDSKFKELMMSVSGTVIGKKEGDTMKLSSKPSLVLTKELMEKYIGIKQNGGSAEVPLYSCDENQKCLNPEETKEKLKYDETLYGNIERIIRSLIKKIIANTSDELTDEEASLIEFSSVPLINLIEIEVSNKSIGSDLSLLTNKEFIEVVCFDVIINYMQQVVSKARSAVEELEQAQLDTTAIEKFNSNIREVGEFLRDKRFEAFKKLNTVIQVKDRIKQQQKVFEMEFSRFYSAD